MINTDIAARTDMGRIRTNNEDSFVVQRIWDDTAIIAVAIDGVGGYEGGEVAAELARKTIIDYLRQYSDGERLDLVKQAVVQANNTIYQARKEMPFFNSMSCVLTAALVDLQVLTINMVHVGDTRLYQYMFGELKKLSHDHSLIGYREEIGDLTEEEAMRHPQRGVLSKDLGSEFLEISDEYIETESFPILADNTLLLCSDGLCDMITSQQMTEILSTDLSLEAKASRFIAAANEAGGKDNITVVLVDMKNVKTKEEDTLIPPAVLNASSKSKRMPKIGKVIKNLFLLCCVAIVILFCVCKCSGRTSKSIFLGCDSCMIGK